jgi:hypothetical protein
MTSIVGNMTSEIIDLVYRQTRKNKNKKKIKYIVDILTNFLFEDIKPYTITILGILILMFVMNCFQFYWYMKAVKITQFT